MPSTTTTATWSRLLSLDLAPISPKTYLQGAVYEPVQKEWFLAQARQVKTGGELMLVHRFDQTGAFQDTMTLEYSHGSPFGVRSIPSGTQIWFGRDEMKNGKVNDRQVMRLLHRPIYEKQYSDHMIPCYVFAGDWARPFLDVDNGLMATRSIDSDGQETYMRRKIADVLDKSDKRLNRLRYTEKGATFQGCATSGNRLLRMYGETSTSTEATPTIIVENRWNDGKEVRRAAFHRMGLMAAEERSYEPEGLCFIGTDLIAGVRVGSPTNRTFRLGTITFS